MRVAIFSALLERRFCAWARAAWCGTPAVPLATGDMVSTSVGLGGGQLKGVAAASFGVSFGTVQAVPDGGVTAVLCTLHFSEFVNGAANCRLTWEMQNADPERASAVCTIAAGGLRYRCSPISAPRVITRQHGGTPSLQHGNSHPQLIYRQCTGAMPAGRNKARPRWLRAGSAADLSRADRAR